MTAVKPWYLSLTVKWTDDKPGLEKLKAAIDEILKGRVLPYFHKCLPDSALHSTVTAIAEISCFPPKGSAEAYMNSLFQELATEDLIAELKSRFTPIVSKADKLRCWDTGTVVQFADSPQIAVLRKTFSELLAKHVELLGRERAGFSSLLTHAEKSVGERFYGSWARSVHPTGGNQLRWEVELSSHPELRFKSVLLLVSDDALTNRHSGENSRRIHSS